MKIMSSKANLWLCFQNHRLQQSKHSKTHELLRQEQR